MFWFFCIACQPSHKSDDQPEFDLEIIQEPGPTCINPYHSEASPFVPQVLSVNTPEKWEIITPDPPTYASGGVIILDVDSDQDLDIMSFSQDQAHLFINDGDASFAEDNSRLPTLPLVFYNGGSAADYDNDGDLDIYLSTSQAPDIFLEQTPSGFVDRSNDIGISQNNSYSGAAAWADMDLDGDLELLVAGYGNDIITQSDGSFDEANPSHLYINQGGAFTPHASLPPTVAPEPFTFSATWLPLDASPPLDILLANDLGPFVHPNLAYLNDGSTWTESSVDLGLNLEIFSMGVAITSWDSDSLPDILITNIGDPVFLSSDNGQRVDLTQSIGLMGTEEEITSWGALWLDIDNDAFEDLWLGYGPLPLNDTENGPPNPPDQPDRILKRSGNQLIDMAEAWGLDRRSNTRGAAMADLNKDGFVDMVRKSIDGPPELFLNQCNENNWLSITLEDEIGNRNAIGSHIVLHTANSTQQRWVLAGGTSFLSSFPGTAYFGLNTEAHIEDVIVTWPDGENTRFTDIQTNHHIHIRRILASSNQ